MEHEGSIGRTKKNGSNNLIETSKGKDIGIWMRVSTEDQRKEKTWNIMRTLEPV